MTLFINNSESFAGFFVRLACTAVCQCVETASIIFLSRHVVEPVMGCHDGARIYHMLLVAGRVPVGARAAGVFQWTLFWAS